ncbi:MAG: hypothetical protein ACI9SP_003564 [Arenicella sp.]|jgi:hypothetical protein
MKLAMQIDMDIKSLKNYFGKLFKLLDESKLEEANFKPVTYDSDSSEYGSPHLQFSHLIKPDMLANIYSLVDYYSKQICDGKKVSKCLNLSSKDIKGDNDLNARYKYLTKYAGLDLESVKNSYDHLNFVREIRNQLVHKGGHVVDEKIITKIKLSSGVQLFGSLILIEEQFIWDSLDHADKFLKYTSEG